MIWPATPTGSRKVKLSAFAGTGLTCPRTLFARDRKSTRLNSSHVSKSYAVFCLKKKDLPFFPELPASYQVDAWLPPAPHPSRNERVSNNYYTFARLNPPVSLARAQSEMDATNHA